MSRSNRSRVRRDNVSIANQRLPDPFSRFIVPPVSYSPLNSFLRAYEDRRQWHPEGIYAPARSFNQTRHRLRIVDPYRSSVQSRRVRSKAQVPRLWRGPGFGIGFQRPSRVLVCVRRKVRAEVLHAFRKTGRYGQRRPRFSQYSRIICKR